MEKTIEIPKGYEARIEGRKVIIELKESEDERIRKAIGAAICGTTAEVVLEANGVKLVDALSYLEKQKDESQKQFNLGVQAGREEVVYEMEKEQKPAEWSEEDNEKNRCHLNTKEIKVGDIITYFRDGKKGIMLVSSFDSGIYPRCKWGITDIDGTAYGDWAPGSGPYYTATEKERQQLYDTMPREVKDWLKSLRPQPHWKPSEEQMGALNYAYCELFKREDVGHNILGPLQDLIDTLSKL